MSISDIYDGWGRLTKVLALVAALAVVAGAIVAGIELTRPDLSCGEGVSKKTPDGECTGVTDGAFSFSPALDAVSHRIKVENDSIADRPHVTVAVMIPMTGLAQSVSQDRVLRQLQGAYLAQYRANHDDGGRTPPIRLVLANPGSDSFDWRPVTEQLAGMAASTQDNLRAVTGFDRSVPSTKAAIAHLTRDLKIPVVGGAITADDLANSPQAPKDFPGLVRVVPTNTGEADALSYYGAQSGTPESAVVVEDTREDDNYITTLKRAFERNTKVTAAHQPQTYTSPQDINQVGNIPNVFDIMIQNICQSQANTIYFAGRYLQLRLFINRLGARGCTTKPYTVLSGSEANSLLADPELDWAALSKNVTVRYVSLAHRDMWTGPAVNGGSAEDLQALSARVDQAAKEPVGPIGPTDLFDSRTIVMHDTVWTAISGIRLSVSGTTPPATSANPLPSITDVADIWQFMHSKAMVKGAGGWICLDQNGNPYDKALAIVELRDNPRAAKFVGLAWPTGKPPEEDCTAPNS
ncbi:ABC transporter substrate-binding protein [Kitasatospora sp. NPDC096204]|uniref:ABC transporter substrate-binding protein n=1 Tax=Kitasatospora sp. NPDC096204 TaxID=3364094 RepID=UPI00382334FF